MPHLGQGGLLFNSPLTTLRDNVIITIQDPEGNEVSHTVIQTMSIVERGSWDEFISLRGGGNVHMKLQFVLSEEERNRIRSMRESAMKKKGAELLTNSLTRDNVKLGVIREVSDSKRSITHNEELSFGNPPVRDGVGDEERTAIDKKQTKPNDADGSGETSSSVSMSKSLDTDVGDVNQSKSLEKIETKLCHVDLPKRPTSFQERSSTEETNLVASKLKVVRADQLEKQDPLGKTSTNDVRPGMKPTPTAKSLFKDTNSKDMTKAVKLTSERLKESILTGESQRVQTYGAKREEHTGFGNGLNGEPISKVVTKPVKQTSERIKNPFVIGESPVIQTYEVKREDHIGFHKDSNENKPSQDTGQLKEPITTQLQIKEVESIPRLREDFLRMSEVEAISVRDRRGSGIGSSNSRESSVLEFIEDKMASTALCENEYFSCESSGAWIFPDHRSRLCITAGSNQVMDFVEGFGIQERTHKEKKSFSLPQNLEKFHPNIDFGNDTENKVDETSHELRKTQHDNSAEGETSNGPIGQAIKVAIMVAFGVLLLLTRQRKRR